jgi:TetR/AcrR family transcriptional regulator
MSTLPRREREKLQRRNDIIDAAEKRFFEKEFDIVSMDEIAHDLELSKPTLYLYFKNKESLYFAVILRGMVTLRSVFKDAVAKEKTGIGKVWEFIHAFFFDYVRKHSDYYRLIVVARERRFMAMLRNNRIEGANQFGDMAMEMLTFLIDAIKVGIEDGTIRADLDPLQTAIFLVVACESAAQMAPEYQILLTHKGLTTDEYLQHSIKVMLQGIAKGKTEKII